MNNLSRTKPYLKHLSIYTGVLVAALIIFLLLSGCGDTCKTTVTYKTFKPIYASMTTLRTEVEVLPPQPRETQGKIYVYGDYLLLGDPGTGIHVFNNSDETNPINLSFINIPGNFDMAVRGGKLYADSYVDLLVFDITDPTNITLAKRLEGVFPSYNSQFGVWAEGDQIVTSLEEQEAVEISKDCADNSSGVIYLTEDLVAFDAVNSANISTDPAIGIGGSTARFTIVGAYLYAVDDYLMHIFDISAPENPIAQNNLDLGWGIETIFPYKNNLFIGSQSGMSVYNIDNPAQPQYMSGVSHITTCDPVVANDTYAFVTLRSNNNNNWCGNTFTNRLDVIDITDVTNAQLLYNYDMTNPYGLGLDGNTLFVTEGDDGLKVFDITDVSKIDQHMVQHLTGFNAYDVIPNNGTLILTGKDGLYQFDYTNLDEIKLLSLITYSAQ